MRVWIEEEYGYRSWVLTTDKTVEEIIKWWESHSSCCCLHEIPEVFASLGKVEEVDYEDCGYPAVGGVGVEWPVSFHYHEDEDSCLRVGKKYYHHAGWKKEI